MKAIIQGEYGAPEVVLHAGEIDKPAVRGDEVLVQVHAAGVAGDDRHLTRGLPYVARLATGLLSPRNRIPGRDVAGRVEAVGGEVTRFRRGDEVFGWCEGAFAEYVSVSEDALAPKPANLTLEQAAVVPVSAMTALQGLRDVGRIQPGQRVLIIGASGDVGTFAVQIAKAFGARVTGVCSTTNVDLVRSIGADDVIDYTREDCTDRSERYDLILDMVCDRSFSEYRRALDPGGTLVMVGGSGGRRFKGTHRFLTALLLSPFLRQRLRPLIHRDRRDDLMALRELIEAGKLTAVIGARYPLTEVTAAIRHFDEGHARRKVGLTV